MAGSGSWRKASFWAPFLALHRKGPSRWRPTSSAPPGFLARWAAAFWQMRVSWSSPRVMPAGQIWVTPRLSS